MTLNTKISDSTSVDRIRGTAYITLDNRGLIPGSLIPDRVAPGGCPPEAPTDPNVRN